MELSIKRLKYVPTSINISGSKNSVVAILCASILSDESVVLENVPNIKDVQTLIDILCDIGFRVTRQDDKILIEQIKKISSKIKDDKIKLLRGSYYFIGSMLGKIGKVSIPHSGGCDLGYRPINYHLEGFEKMNSIIKLKNDKIIIKSKKLSATSHSLKFPSVGATINIMLASVKTPGTTTISNCALEPEVEDVANFLNSMGAKISGAGTNTIIIEGVEYLYKTNYKIMSDRIEAGTYLILGSLFSGITVKNINPLHLTSLLDLFTSIGINVITTDNSIQIKKKNKLTPFNITTGPYPLFPTDLGQQLSVLATQIEGTSTIEENIFENRFSHVNALKALGADLNIQHNTLIIKGKTTLTNSCVKAYDLRGAAATVLACCLSRNESIIDNIDVFFRGYEEPIKKLRRLGIECHLIEKKN